MKKLFLGFVLSFFSLAALATTHGHEMIFKGGGEWKNNSGEKGNYSLMSTHKMLEDGSFKISSTIDKGDQVMNYVTIVTKDANGFLSAKNEAGDVIGSGYSYDLGPVHICHLDMTPEEGVKVEMTVKGNLDEFHAIGSMVKGDLMVSWIEGAKRIYPKK